MVKMKIKQLPKEFLKSEMCRCGHSRLVHGDTLAQGHGQCLINHCNCKRFFWVKNTTKE